MPHQPIIELQEGAAVHQFFRLRQVEKRTTKAGKPFLNLVLGDKTGVLKARVWDEVLKKCPGPFAPGQDVGVKGQVESYQGELQVNVQFIESVDQLRARGKPLPEYDPELLDQATPYDRRELWQELWRLAESIEPPVQLLVLRLLAKYQDEIMAGPAAQKYHHPYLGGLLEHTWSVTRHARQSLEVYAELNGDLVLAGAILHDLGKVKELANPQAPEMTAPGQLLGHIVLGWEMVKEEARALDFPDPDLLLQLEHIILSHHGALEFGSPVVPKTREALLVYFLDDLDAKMKMMDQHLQSDTGQGEFTGYLRVLQRELYKGRENPPNGSAPLPEPENSEN